MITLVYKGFTESLYAQMLTRTIKVSCLSCFLQFSATYPDKLITMHPDSLSCPQFKYCTLTHPGFETHYIATAAPLFSIEFIYREK